MNHNYLEVLYEIVDKEYKDESEESKNEMKSIIKTLVNSEKEYEFSENRTRIKQILESIL